jgi:zinc-binding alcohol dehydrogenase family protein
MAATKTMKAYGQTVWGSKVALELRDDVPRPELGTLDLLVRVRGLGANPVDNKARGGMGGEKEGDDIGSFKVVGWDVSGVVEEVGADAAGSFTVGDEVYFSGAIHRQGAFAEYVAVDHRIVARKPTSLSHEFAAAMPLTSITAFEALGEVVGGAQYAEGKTVLVIGGAGGVGSIAIQLAKRHFRYATVVATASRPETRAYCESLGADYVISHREDLGEQLKQVAGLDGVDVVLNATEADRNINTLAPIVNPLGHIVIITTLSAPLDINQFFAKRISLHIEFMFSRPLLNAAPEKQGALLATVAKLIDDGVIAHRVRDEYRYKLAQINEALTQQESGTTIGKIVLDVDWS